mgnify:CR=1 FL=1
MNSNPFYNQFFNQQYVNPVYYRQSQEQIIQYQQEQSKEVPKVYEFGHQRVREHLCGIYEFLETKKMENLQELERKNK